MLLEGHAQYLIATAARAPSVHNSQPWRFQVAEDAIELLSDPGRRTGTDDSGREMLISCGAALFGLRLAMRSLGFQPVVELLPDPAQLRLLARVRPGRWRCVPMNALEVRMLAAVPRLHTHRGAFEPGPLPAGLLPGLQNDAFVEGTELALVPPAATAMLLTKGDRRADWLHAGQALHRMLLHAASEWVFASLYTQPLEDPVTRTLIPGQLGIAGHSQMILQFGRAVTAAVRP
jgi:nitroreductase